MNEVTSFQGEYRFLSNFWPCEVTFEGKVYSTTEAAYQAAKTLDESIREIFTSYNPFKAKKAGQSLEVRDDWNYKKVEVMLELQRKKYSDSNLKDLLLSTGDYYLIEGNTWHDNFWGDCSCDKCKNIEGLNVLGNQLMIVRKESSRQTVIVLLR